MEPTRCSRSEGAVTPLRGRIFWPKQVSPETNQIHAFPPSFSLGQLPDVLASGALCDLPLLFVTGHSSALSDHAEHLQWDQLRHLQLSNLLHQSLGSVVIVIDSPDSIQRRPVSKPSYHFRILFEIASSQAPLSVVARANLHHS